jgi:hypothetical protein
MARTTKPSPVAGVKTSTDALPLSLGLEFLIAYDVPDGPVVARQVAVHLPAGTRLDPKAPSPSIVIANALDEQGEHYRDLVVRRDSWGNVSGTVVIQCRGVFDYRSFPWDAVFQDALGSLRDTVVRDSRLGAVPDGYLYWQHVPYELEGEVVDVLLCYFPSPSQTSPTEAAQLAVATAREAWDRHVWRLSSRGPIPRQLLKRLEEDTRTPTASTEEPLPVPPQEQLLDLLKACQRPARPLPPPDCREWLWKRDAAEKELGRLGARAMPAYLALLDCGDKRISRLVEYGLGCINPLHLDPAQLEAGVLALSRCRRCGGAEPHGEAAARDHVGDPAAVPVLVEAIGDRDFLIVEWASLALQRWIGAEATRHLLLARALLDPDEHVRRVNMVVLGVSQNDFLAKATEKIKNGTLIVTEPPPVRGPVLSPEEKIKELLAEQIPQLPSGAEEKAEAIIALNRTLNQTFWQGLRGEAEPLIKSLLENIPADYEGKRRSATLINALLAALDKGILVHDQDGRTYVCSVRATHARPTDTTGNFRLTSRTARGGSQRSFPMPSSLEQVQIVDTPRQERDGHEEPAPSTPTF